MKLAPQWIRDFVDLPVDNGRLAEDLTSIGIAVEAISGEGANTVFEMEIGTNRPDAMNHYGVAREASAFYGVGLKAIEAAGAKAPSKPAITGTAEAVPSRNITSAPKGAPNSPSVGSAKAEPFQIHSARAWTGRTPVRLLAARSRSTFHSRSNDRG